MMRGLPSSVAWFVRWLGGVDTAMNEWRGSEVFAKEQNVALQNGKH